MKTNSKYEVIARIARQSLVLAALLAMGLSAASICRAQSSAASPVAPGAKSAAAPAKASALPAAKPPAKGQHEGITVHGHWTIDVKNADGKLVTHREFENSLMPQGADVLTGLLSGQYVSGGFAIGFATTTTPNPPTFGISGGSGLCGGGVCSLLDGRTFIASIDCTTASANAGQCGLLTYTANGTSPGFATGFTLTGIVSNIAGGGQIQSVATAAYYCNNGPTTGSQAFYTLSSQQCGAVNFGNADPPYVPAASFLTGTTITPVNVTAGQSVAVTVVITFGSPS